MQIVIKPPEIIRVFGVFSVLQPSVFRQSARIVLSFIYIPPCRSITAARDA